MEQSCQNTFLMGALHQLVPCNSFRGQLSFSLARTLVALFEPLSVCVVHKMCNIFTLNRIRYRPYQATRTARVCDSSALQCKTCTPRVQHCGTVLVLLHSRLCLTRSHTSFAWSLYLDPKRGRPPFLPGGSDSTPSVRTKYEVMCNTSIQQKLRFKRA